MAKKKQRPKIVDNELRLTEPRGSSIMRQFYKPPRTPGPVKITRPARLVQSEGDEIK